MNRIKKTYPSYYRFEKEDIVSLAEALDAQGFSHQVWKVPINNNFDVNDGVFTTKNYFALNYNFAAVIGVFENPSNKDTVKIMFVNNQSSMKKFNDFTFPSSQSEGPKYYIESEDEIRVHGLADYLKNILKRCNRNKGPQYRFGSFINVASLIYIGFYFIILKYITDNYPNLVSVATIFLIATIIIVFLYFISLKRGIYINSFPNPLLSFVDQMIKGSFIENPITFVFLRLLAVIVTGIVGGFAFNFFQSLF